MPDDISLSLEPDADGYYRLHYRGTTTRYRSLRSAKAARKRLLESQEGRVSPKQEAGREAGRGLVKIARKAVKARRKKRIAKEIREGKIGKTIREGIKIRPKKKPKFTTAVSKSAIPEKETWDEKRERLRREGKMRPARVLGKAKKGARYVGGYWAEAKD
jgi:hypothetical protein